MDIEQLRGFFDELSALAERGDEAAAKALIRKRFLELPKDVQGELLTRLYFLAAEEEAIEAGAAAAVQERALDLAAALESLKAQVE